MVYNTITYNNSAVINEETSENDSTLSTPEGDRVLQTLILARTEASYNVFSVLLSYASGNSLGIDVVRGTINNSLLNGGGNVYNIFEGYSDASSYNDEKRGTNYENCLSRDSFLGVEAQV